MYYNAIYNTIFDDVENIVNPMDYTKLQIKIDYYLSENSIIQIFDKISSFLNLEELFLYGYSKYLIIPKSITKLQKLKKFILYNNPTGLKFEDVGNPLLDEYYKKLNKVIDFICEMPNIEVLNVTNYGLTEIPKNINKLKSTLKSVDFSHNSIFNLREELFDCINLEQIHMIKNNIKNVSKDICKLQKLKKLEITTNNMPNEICSLFDLEHLLHDHYNYLNTIEYKYHYEHNNKMIITRIDLINLNILNNKLTHLNIMDYCSHYHLNILNNLPKKLTHLRIKNLKCELKNLPITLKYLYVNIQPDYDVETNIKIPFGCTLICNGI